MNQHIVSAFDTEIKELQKKIAEMGGIAEKMLSDALEAIEKRDTGIAQRIIAMDQRLDGLQRDIDERAILTIARRQPMAVDLRDIFVVSQIAATSSGSATSSRTSASASSRWRGSSRPRACSPASAT